MKAFILKERNHAEIAQVGSPILENEYGAKIKPTLVSVCTSDINTVYGTGSKKPKNLILGHEGIGEIIEVGRKVADFKVGDQVLIPSMTPNWLHPDVEDGNILHAGANFSANALSRSKGGVFAEECIVDFADMNLALLPENVDREEALMCADMVTTGFSGAESLDIKYGDCIAVFGIGAVGLMAIQGAVLKGAGRIFAIGSKSVNMALAKKYGATDSISYKTEDVVEYILRETAYRGVDGVIICGGDDSVFSQAMQVCRYGVGRIANLKLFTGDGDMSFSKFHSGRGMAGKQIFMELGKGGRRRMERLLSLLQYGRIAAKDLVTHRFCGYEGLSEAFALMRKKEEGLIKTAISLNEE